MATKLLILAGFLVAFSAGLVVGSHRSRQMTALVGPAAPGTGSGPTTGPATRPARHRGMIAAELGLSPEQASQLNAIWSDVAKRGHDREEQRRQLVQERDQAIAALVPASDQPEYQAALDQFAQRRQALDEQWRGLFQSAVERTKQLLTPEQRAKYEELLKRNHWDRGGRGGDRGGEHGADRGGRTDEGRRSGDRATTRPAGSEQ